MEKRILKPDFDLTIKTLKGKIKDLEAKLEKLELALSTEREKCDILVNNLTKHS